MITQNQITFSALCIKDTKTLRGTKALSSGLIYKLIPRSANVGRVGYEIYLDGEYMGVITDDEFDRCFVKTTLVSLAELHAIDGNREVIVWC